MTRSLLLSDPPRHGLLRRPLAPGLSAPSSEQFSDHVRQTAIALTEQAVRRSSFDIVRDLAVPVSFGVLGQALGIPIDDPWECKKDVTLIADALDMRVGKAADADEACGRLRRRMEAAIDDGSIRPGGMAAAMLAEADAGRWTREDVIANLVFILFAGQETVVDTLGNALVALEACPEQRRLLETGEVGWRSAAEELLRYCAPVHYSGARIAAEDFDFEGIPVRAGEAVVPVLASANRDQQVFPSGDRLDLRQPVSSQLAFGTGLHVCLGQHVARVEVAAMLEALFTHAPGWRLDLQNIVRRRSILFYGLRSVPILLRSTEGSAGGLDAGQLLDLSSRP